MQHLKVCRFFIFIFIISFTFSLSLSLASTFYSLSTLQSSSLLTTLVTKRPLIMPGHIIINGRGSGKVGISDEPQPENNAGRPTRVNQIKFRSSL